jgi:hypothetical protein
MIENFEERLASVGARTPTAAPVRRPGLALVDREEYAVVDHPPEVAFPHGFRQVGILAVEEKRDASSIVAVRPAHLGGPERANRPIESMFNAN